MLFYDRRTRTHRYWKIYCDLYGIRLCFLNSWQCFPLGFWESTLYASASPSVCSHLQLSCSTIMDSSEKHAVFFFKFSLNVEKKITASLAYFFHSSWQSAKWISCCLLSFLQKESMDLRSTQGCFMLLLLLPFFSFLSSMALSKFWHEGAE